MEMGIFEGEKGKKRTSLPAPQIILGRARPLQRRTATDKRLSWARVDSVEAQWRGFSPCRRSYDELPRAPDQSAPGYYYSPGRTSCSCRLGPRSCQVTSAKPH